MAYIYIISSCLLLINLGEEIISINDLLGYANINFREYATNKNNLKFTFFDFKDITKFKLLLNDKVKMLYMEITFSIRKMIIIKLQKKYNKNKKK